MAPRGPDAARNYKHNKHNKKLFDLNEFRTCLLHKKHKVVKLVEAQLQKIREEGIVCCDTEDINQEMRFGEVMSINPEYYAEEFPNPQENYTCKIINWLVRLLIALLIILLVVWIAAGPLSNKSPHTPLSLWNSFISTDNLCTLEKKYLLRWSVSEYPD